VPCCLLTFSYAITPSLLFLTHAFLPFFSLFFFNDPPTPKIYPLSLHDALPIWPGGVRSLDPSRSSRSPIRSGSDRPRPSARRARSEEHTSELQSLTNLVCRLLLEKKKKKSSYEARSCRYVSDTSRGLCRVSRRY